MSALPPPERFGSLEVAIMILTIVGILWGLTLEPIS